MLNRRRSRPMPEMNYQIQLIQIRNRLARSVQKKKHPRSMVVMILRRLRQRWKMRMRLVRRPPPNRRNQRGMPKTTRKKVPPQRGQGLRRLPRIRKKQHKDIFGDGFEVESTSILEIVRENPKLMTIAFFRQK